MVYISTGAVDHVDHAPLQFSTHATRCIHRCLMAIPVHCKKSLSVCVWGGGVDAPLLKRGGAPLPPSSYPSVVVVFLFSYPLPLLCFMLSRS